MRRRMDSLEAGHTLAAMSRDRLEREFYNIQVWIAERMGWGAMEARPSDSIDVLAVYGESRPQGSQGLPDGPQTEGVVGLSRWFEKMESVFEINKCAEEDKVKFAACTLKGRALTWWNGNAKATRIGESNKRKWRWVKDFKMILRVTTAQ
ncbi:hypothetical protein Tco_1441148, partial [Tanacetum coccineum]